MAEEENIMTASADQANPGRTVTAQMTARYPEMVGKVAVVTGAAQGMGCLLYTSPSPRD